jgi:hypothetical protein
MLTFPRSLRAFALAVSALFAVPAAQAITPESGFWYNVNEPGTGISLEITDNFLFMAAYGFDNAGFPMWYTSGGFMSSDRQYNGGLASFRNGQPFGGIWTAPTYQGDTGGQVSIAFDGNDETKATITWFGRSYQIQRTDFFRSAYGVGNNIHQTQRMLGEWTMVFDLYNSGPDSRALPFFGDVLIFDLIDTASNPDFYEGCRPTTSLTGECTSAALSAHDAAGYYDAPNNEHLFVVKDIPASGGLPTKYIAYFVVAGLTQFDGVISIYAQGGNPEAGPFFPVRGFRSASRKFVVDGTGPSSVDDDSKSLREPVSLAKTILDANGGVLPAGMTADEVKQKYGIDVKTLGSRLQPLVQHMQNKRPRK